MKGIPGQTAASLFVLIMLTAVSLPAASQLLSAKEIVTKADEKFNGEKSGFSVMSMTIVRPTWQRTVEFKSWSLGDDYALTLITAPAREKGQTFLKRLTEMWSWNPAISRLIKLPPSMMSQGWMGSDYTNDDILRESSVVNDYDHSLEGEEVVDGRLCHKIRLTAREDAGVLWSHQMWWVDRKDFIVLKAELYDEDGYLRAGKISEASYEITRITMSEGRKSNVRLLFHQLNQAKEKLAIVIKDNPSVYDTILDIL